MTHQLSYLEQDSVAFGRYTCLEIETFSSFSLCSDLLPKAFAFFYDFFRLFSLLLCCHILHRVMKLWIFLESKWVRSSLQMSMATSSPKRSAFPSYCLLLAAKSLQHSFNSNEIIILNSCDKMISAVIIILFTVTLFCSSVIEWQFHYVQMLMCLLSGYNCTSNAWSTLKYL